MYLAGIHHCYLRFTKRKVNANREQNLSSLLEQLCRDAALLTQKYKDFLKRQNVSTFFYQFNQKIPQGAGLAGREVCERNVLFFNLV